MIQRLPHTRLGREHRIEMTPESRWESADTHHTGLADMDTGYLVKTTIALFMCVSPIVQLESLHTGNFFQ